MMPVHIRRQGLIENPSSDLPLSYRQYRYRLHRLGPIKSVRFCHVTPRLILLFLLVWALPLVTVLCAEGFLLIPYRELLLLFLFWIMKLLLLLSLLFPQLMLHHFVGTDCPPFTTAIINSTTYSRAVLVCVFLCLFCFLTSLSTTRLYRGRAPELKSDNFTCRCTRDRAGDHDFCLNRSQQSSAMICCFHPYFHPEKLW